MKSVVLWYTIVHDSLRTSVHGWHAMLFRVIDMHVCVTHTAVFSATPLVGLITTFACVVLLEHLLYCCGDVFV